MTLMFASISWKMGFIIENKLIRREVDGQENDCKGDGENHRESGTDRGHANDFDYVVHVFVAAHGFSVLMRKTEDAGF